MAIFYPSLEVISKLKVPPTEGERTLLDFLGRVLDDSYEVYFNPYLNGDRPDVVIMRKGNGVMIIEVKDWNLNNFSLNEKKKWVYNSNGSIVKSPLDQVLKYKENLFNLHVDKLLEKNINDKRHFRIVSCAVYFHCASQFQVDYLLITPFQRDRKYQDFLKYNIDLIGKDELVKERFIEILQKRYLSIGQNSFLFTEELYNNFRRILSPSIHMREEANLPYRYSTKQKEIIYGKFEKGEYRINLEQRVKGVFGSGKTTVLAARAVQAYKRALVRNNKPRILILTYNITLKNFIHDKLNMVYETFEWDSFIIINYHSFINAELNNLNIDIIVPKNYLKEQIGEYLEQNYYSNISLFEEHKSEIVKYDAVLIDEIQDYHRPWMDIIKNYFRDPQGDYVLFGDVKQNIYGQQTSQKDVVTNVLGVKDLKYCYRSDFKVMELAETYQTNVFGDRYDIDDFSENKTNDSFDFSSEKVGYINYIYLSNTNSIVSLYNIIRGNILNKENNISPNDITIIGFTIKHLREFDCYYRYASRERTNTMFETIEAMYMTHLNFFGKDLNNADLWFKEISTYIINKRFSNRKELSDNDMVIIRLQIAKLLTLYDLYIHFPETFIDRLNEECQNNGLSSNKFFAIYTNNIDEINIFKNKVYDGNYNNIRENKKLHFWMNSGTIKISTVHSFKGWESEVVFLLIEPLYEQLTDYNASFDEIIYTGLTRCKRDLIIINLGNKQYDDKIKPLIERIKFS